MEQEGKHAQGWWRFLVRLLIFPVLLAFVVLVFPAFKGERLSWLRLVIAVAFTAAIINELIRWLIRVGMKNTE
jgi:hypothetical protein